MTNIRDIFTTTWQVKDEYNIKPNEKYDFEGKNVVFSGKLVTMERTEAANKIRALGGYLQKSVNSMTDVIVVPDDFKTETAKLKRGKKDGIRIITERQFIGSIR